MWIRLAPIPCTCKIFRNQSCVSAKLDGPHFADVNGVEYLVQNNKAEPCIPAAIKALTPNFEQSFASASNFLFFCSRPSWRSNSIWQQGKVSIICSYYSSSKILPLLHDGVLRDFHHYVRILTLIYTMNLIADYTLHLNSFSRNKILLHHVVAEIIIHQKGHFIFD